MRRVGTVLLCEDSQHEAFVRRFLKKRRLVTGHLRVEKCPDGSAEQFVRKQYPIELAALRARYAKSALIVVIDESACQSHVETLAAMCEAGQLRVPAPPSLQDACEGYEGFRAKL